MERIFYKTDITDAYTNLPIYVFDTSYLPVPEEISYDLFVPTLMHRIPQEPYVVIMFSCGLNKINWVWGISFLKAFLTQNSSMNSNVENLHKIIAVHESWFVKSICQIFSNFLISRKSLNNLNLQNWFRNPPTAKHFLISCDSLSELSKYVNIIHLKLSLNIYRHDCQVTLSPTLKLHSPINPVIKSSTDYLQHLSPLFYHHFYQLFHIIDIYAQEVELIFHKPGKKLNTDILFLCLMRNQLIWVNDWDLNCIASCFKKILAEVSEPLLPVDCIELPMKDDFAYTMKIFLKLMEREHKNAVLFQILSLCSKIVLAAETTKHTPLSVLKSLSHSLTHEPISHHSQHRVSMAVRYLKNVIVHWDRIRPRYLAKFKTVRQIINGNHLPSAAIDELYNMSHSISVDDAVSSEEDRSLGLRTDNDNILDPNISSSSLQSNSTYVNSPKTTADKGLLENPFEENFSLSQNGRSSGGKEIKAKSLGNNPPEVPPSPETKTSSTKKHVRSSSIQVQFPPQKYKFEKRELHRETPKLYATKSETPERHATKSEIPERHAIKSSEEVQVPRLPVIRGRKVGELTRIFEERSRAIEILKTM